MAFGSKWLGLTLPLAAFLGSAVGVVVSQQMIARTNPPPVLATGTWMPVPVTTLPPVQPKVQPEAIDDSGMPPMPEPGGRAPFGDAAPADPMAGAEPGPDGVEESPDPMTGPEMILPPDYFELAAPHRNDGTDPPILQPGQLIVVEVLEALPGRPISGKRVIRPDGTISLGFYGDLHVAGLNRLQAKVKLLELLNKHLTHQVLGVEALRDDKWILRPAVESDRVFIDESINFEPQNTTLPRTRSGLFDPATELSRLQVEALSAKLDELINNLSRTGQVEPPKPDGKPAPPASKTPQDVPSGQD